MTDLVWADGAEVCSHSVPGWLVVAAARDRTRTAKVAPLAWLCLRSFTVTHPEVASGSDAVWPRLADVAARFGLSGQHAATHMGRRVAVLARLGGVRIVECWSADVERRQRPSIYLLAAGRPGRFRRLQPVAQERVDRTGESLFLGEVGGERVVASDEDLRRQWRVDRLLRQGALARRRAENRP